MHTALVPLLACVALAAAQDPVSPADEAPLETRSYSIPETRLVRARFESAEAHAAAGRHGEAIVELQRILVEHPSELLPGERPTSDLGHRSDQPVHPGAAQRARARLFALPAEARTLYAERHEPDAARALAAA